MTSHTKRSASPTKSNRSPKRGLTVRSGSTTSGSKQSTVGDNTSSLTGSNPTDPNRAISTNPDSVMDHTAATNTGESPPDQPDQTETANSPPSPLFKPVDINVFRGHTQPAPKERLEEALIFLADEDYHRYLDFQHKLAQIEAYVDFLEMAKHTGDFYLLKQVRESINVHKDWIKRATEVPPISFHFAQFNHQNRLLHLIRDPRKRQVVENIKASKIPLDISSGPALHINIDEEEKQKREIEDMERNGIGNTDPFFHTKEMAKIRRRLGHMALETRVKDAPTNFNGPYISRQEDPDTIQAKYRSLDKVIRRLQDAKTRTPRPFIDHIWNILGDEVKGNKTTKPVTQADINLLLVLTESSWYSNGNNNPQILGLGDTDSFTFFAQTVENLFKKAAPDDPTTIQHVLDKVNDAAEKKEKNYGFTRQDVITYIKSMAGVNGIR